MYKIGQIVNQVGAASPMLESFKDNRLLLGGDVGDATMIVLTQLTNVPESAEVRGWGGVRLSGELRPLPMKALPCQ